MKIKIRYLVLTLLTVLIVLNLDCMAQINSDKCEDLQSIIDPKLKKADAAEKLSLGDEKSVTDAIECFLKLKGKKYTSLIGGATKVTT